LDVCFKICEGTDKQTDTLITILHTPAGGEVKNYVKKINENECKIPYF